MAENKKVQVGMCVFHEETRLKKDQKWASCRKERLQRGCKLQGLDYERLLCGSRMWGSQSELAFIWSHKTKELPVTSLRPPDPDVPEHG